MDAISGNQMDAKCSFREVERFRIRSTSIQIETGDWGFLKALEGEDELPQS
jgi:hypothetical protein